jgi:hypothetical protein
MLKETSSTALTGPKDFAIWERSTVGIKLLLGILDELLELIAIGVKRFAALPGHAAKRQWYLASIGLLYTYVTSLLQFGQMNGEISFRQPGLALKIEEVGALHGSQDGQDEAAGWFMDETIYI